MEKDLVPTTLLAKRPQIVGVVNITEDSFSDGGLYLAADDATAHAKRLRSEGADIIELGPASSHPDSTRVTPDEERRRLAPVLAQLVEENIPVSVDSFLPETQRFALANGATLLNDIQGFPDETVYPDLAASECQLVIMHSIQRRGPATRTWTESAAIWAGINDFFTERLARLEGAGIDRARLIIDPGLGFFLGSNSEPSLVVLAGLGHLKERFELPILVSPSRKSFLQKLTGRDAAHSGSASLAAELYAACQGADIIRTHDVAAIVDALAVVLAISGTGSLLLSDALAIDPISAEKGSREGL